MNEDFVSFSIAKKLKEKGYTLDTAHHYDDNGGIVVSLVEFDERCVYPCPEIHQVLRWLRKEKQLHIVIVTGHDIVTNTYLWGYKIWDLANHVWLHAMVADNSYELAALSGIEFVIDNLLL